MAQEKGFYKAKNLDVTIKEYRHGIDVVHEVVSNQSQFGLGRSSLLINHTQGVPIVALSAIFQHSPFVLISTDPSIKSPRDLYNKRVMITKDAFTSASIVAMLRSQGITEKDIILQKHSFHLQDLIDGKTDAMACYSSNEPYFLEKKGIPFTIFDPKKYGFEFYGEILYTSKDFLKENPETVKNFRQASLEGWEYAFKHIEETAKIIYAKYNTQHKSLDSLIFEGHTLKKLAYTNSPALGTIEPNRLKEISKVYKLSQLQKKDIDYDQFLDPFHSLKKSIYIGVLAKRGSAVALRRWEIFANYLNQELPTYDFKIVPLNFNEIESSVKRKEIDFLITNTMNYVQMEYLYGISRIAALKNESDKASLGLTKFGSVIFTKSDNTHINTLFQLRGHTFGAVDPASFGGWVMAQKELKNSGLDKDSLHVKFYGTHDATVRAVLNKEVDAGTVRTDTLEQMAKEGAISLQNIKVLAPKHYLDFPYLVSTDLYPEWPFSKLAHTSDSLSNKVLSVLLKQPAALALDEEDLFSWTIPLDYSKVHMVLKELNIYPYDVADFTLKEVYQKYQTWILIFFIFLAAVLMRLLYIKHTNYSLEQEVMHRTQELTKANLQLKELANTDELTGISNRRDLLSKLNQAISLAHRYNAPLSLLSLDIDFFKKINDTYGHDVGDMVLKHFVKIVSKTIRTNDYFGRMGGEEFAIILNNTSFEDALVVAEKIRQAVSDEIYHTQEGTPLPLTISIGMSMLLESDSKAEIIKRSDIALYQAKELGRNRVKVDESLSDPSI